MNENEIKEAIEKGHFGIEDVALSLFLPLLVPLALGVAGEIAKAVSGALSKKKK